MAVGLFTAGIYKQERLPWQPLLLYNRLLVRRLDGNPTLGFLRHAYALSLVNLA